MHQHRIAWECDEKRVGLIHGYPESPVDDEAIWRYILLLRLLFISGLGISGGHTFPS